jgi:penicillin-binding protein 1A
MRTRDYNPPVPSASVPPSGSPTPSRPVAARAAARRRWQRWVLPLVAAAAVGSALGVGVAAAIRVPRVEAIAEFSPKLITQLRDRSGAVFATYARERRVLLQAGDVPPVLQNAVVAAEDAEFFRHGGIDALGVLRSVLVNFQRGRHAQGASTITMQLARELFLTREKTWKRKIEEAFLAVELEKTLSKQQILTLYCNLAFLGHGNYGMEAAARDYFGHGVRDLTLPESAALAGIVQRPSEYSPLRSPKKVVARRDYVLRRMREEGYLEEAAYREAIATPLTVQRPRDGAEIALYFAEEVRQQLEARYGTERLYQEGLQADTTLDASVQRGAEEALRAGLLRLDHRKGWRAPVVRGASLLASGVEIEELAGRNPVPDRWVPGLVLDAGPAVARIRLPDREVEVGRDGIAWTGRRAPAEILRQGDVAWFRFDEPEGKPARWVVEQEPAVEGAVVVLESASGAVRALVGGWDFRRNKFDRVTQAQRQVGSAFKPFVYGAALENGFTPADVLFDAPAVFLGADGLPSYSPRNYYRRYYGILTLRRALELSVNVTAVKLQDLIGAGKVVEFTQRCGVKSNLPPFPSLALGSADLTPLELAAAYAAIANQGVYVRPYLVEQVRGRNGTPLERHQLEASKAMEPAVAYVLTSMLEGVVDRGTGAALADLPLAIAGKTGTTNDYTDAWFVGFTPRYTILSWVGYDQKRSLGRKMTGAEAALPIWRKVAEAGLQDGWLREGEDFSVPAGVEIRPIEYWSGLAPSPGAERILEEAFLTGTGPDRTWDPKWDRIRELPWSQQRAFYTPRPGEKMPDAAAAWALAQIAAAGDSEDAAGD